MAVTTTHDADTNFLVRQSMSTGYQAFSVLTPPLYTAFILFRRGRGAWSLNRFLRATWIGGLTGASDSGSLCVQLIQSYPGAAVGGGIAYGRYKYSNDELVRLRRLKVTYDVSI